MSHQIQDYQSIPSNTDDIKHESDVLSMEELIGLPNHYRLLLDSKMVKYCIKKCAHEILGHYMGKIQDGHVVKITLVGVLKGGIYFLTDLSRQLQKIIREKSYPIELTIETIDVKSYHGLEQGEVNIESTFDTSKIIDKEVILIDELIDNGKTINILLDYFRNNKVLNVYSCVAFMKNKSRIIDPTWYGLLVPDVWLIGYGLDDLQKYRELELVCFVSKPEEFEKTEDDLKFCQDIYTEPWKEYYGSIDFSKYV